MEVKESTTCFGGEETPWAGLLTLQGETQVGVPLAYVGRDSCVQALIRGPEWGTWAAWGFLIPFPSDQFLVATVANCHQLIL